jgi:hypothetical protein
MLSLILQSLIYTVFKDERAYLCLKSSVRFSQPSYKMVNLKIN